MLFDTDEIELKYPFSKKYYNMFDHFLINHMIYLNLMIGKITRSGLRVRAVKALGLGRLYLHLNWWWDFFTNCYLNNIHAMLYYVFVKLDPMFNRKLMKLKKKAGSKGTKYRYYDIYLRGKRRFRIISCWSDFFLNYYYHRYFNFRCIYLVLGLRYNLPNTTIHNIIYESGDRNFDWKLKIRRKRFLKKMR